MKVFKFGGASVKDANAVRNVARILSLFPEDRILVVVSAMGKTTNALEKLTEAFFGKWEKKGEMLKEIRDFHFSIARDLFGGEETLFFTELHNTFAELEWEIEGEPEHSFDQVYDQIVSFGEVISTRIVHAYLRQQFKDAMWWDVRDWIRTDETWREGKVDWELTAERISSGLSGTGRITVTQGFLGSTAENFTTTLGREGSDYTAAILAWCMDAESVTIWKDVPGVLNADPKWFDHTVLIDRLTYQDAIELSYYGATVIHPKTLKPLQNKGIPLYVRSFMDPSQPGTAISAEPAPLPIPCFIFKVNQVLISISPKDFSFIVEENLRDIFDLFSRMGVHINTMQNSAISFSVCIQADARKLPDLIQALHRKYRVLYNENVELVTIRYYNQETIDRVTVGKQILLEVKSRYTVQMVMK
ncbi:MAG: aspartate kinase [Bacteroidia bacterium]|nr:aspartate kinase [Bacteroidia bacterium]